MQYVVDLQDIHYRRSNQPILQGVNWTIAPGEHWALLGANGSGKTTLLKIITGYEWPTRGRVRVLDRPYGEVPLAEVRKHIGWVSSALEHRLPGKDTAENVVLSGLESSLGLYRTFTEAERQQARHCLDLLAMSDFADRTFETLSQGEQQRVVIARALVAQPRLLILDEPCAGLDPAAREDFLDDLARLAHTHGAPSLILVTHHIEEIGGFIDHVFVLKEGQVLASGQKDQVLTDNVMSEALGRNVRVDRINDRFGLRL